jgi:mevalonate kinase
MPDEPEFKYIKAVLAACLPSHVNSFRLSIKSNFPISSGLGSSTAVVVAMVNAFMEFYHQPLSQEALFEQSLSIIRTCQQMASGADVAASIAGGCLYYCNGKAEPLPHTPHIDLLFSGTKVPTDIVIQELQHLDDAFTSSIYEQIGECVEIAKLAIIKKDWAALGMCLCDNQRLMEELGLDTPALTFARETLMQKNGMIAAKISGAGMGDYAIGLKD